MKYQFFCGYPPINILLKMINSLKFLNIKINLFIGSNLINLNY